MRKKLDAQVFVAIVDHVALIAGRKALSGVLVITDLSGVVPQTFSSNINRSSCLRIGVEGKRDINFLAVAFSKIAGVVAHGVDSGEERNIFGEVPYKGGHLSDDVMVIYAFSGATPEEDLELAKVAEAFHQSL